MTDRSSASFYVLVQPEGAAEAERVDLTARVLTYEFEDNEKKADLLKLSVNNQDLSNFDDPIWKTGNKLVTAWGYPGAMAPARECVITSVKGGLILTVEAQAKSFLMNKESEPKTYENVRRSELIHMLAEKYGFTGDKRDIEETTVVHAVISQVRQSDAQLIKRLADLEGFEFYVDFDGLHWHRRRMGQKPIAVLQYYLPPAVGDVKTFDVENDVTAKPAKVVLKGRDPLAKKDIVASASDSETPRETTAPVAELIDPVTGAATLASNIASVETKPTTETNAEQAKREADGIFRRTQQATVKLNMTIIGNALICAKSVLEVRGIGKRLSGLYYVNQANHKIDVAGGYELKLKTCTDGTHGHSENLLAREVPAKPKPDSKASPNLNKGETPDPGKMEQIEVVDPTTGKSAIAYRETGGRPPGDAH